MKIPLKKLKNGEGMPEFGIGTWHMGGDWYEYNKGYDATADVAALKKAIDLGVTHFDTAEGYGGGQSEEILGKAIKNYDRSELFIVSKVGADHFKHDDLIESCKTSLKNLKTDYLDIYLMHWYSENVALAETIGALDELVDQGLIKSIGVSNFGVKSLQQAQKLSKHPIVCNQVHYNLGSREPETHGLLEYCQQNDVLLSAWRPVGKGDLLKNPPEVVMDLCKKYNKTPAQIAINWLTSQDNVVTLVKTSSLVHLEENLGAVGWYLEPDDVELLRREYPDQNKYSDAVNLSN